jgi:DNA anti-recombination protein RmuC
MMSREKELEANAQADKKMIESLYKKITVLQTEVDKQKKHIETVEKQIKQLAYAPTKRQLNAMQRIIKTHTEV